MPKDNNTSYRLELRQYGRVLRAYETRQRKEAKDVALQWLKDTSNAVIVLFVDGVEIKLPKIPKALGCKGSELFDTVDRYDSHPVPPLFGGIRTSRKGKAPRYKV